MKKKKIHRQNQKSYRDNQATKTYNTINLSQQLQKHQEPKKQGRKEKYGDVNECQT